MEVGVRVEAGGKVAGGGGAGVCHFISFTGRCGEWEAMKRGHVQEQFSVGASHVVCDEHKTSDTYGELAKFIPPGSWRAFQLYNNLTGKCTDLFLDPPSHAIAKVSVPSYLKRFGLKHFEDKAAPNSTLIRKMYHTHLLRSSREGDLFNFMEKVDAHTAQVAAKVYATTTPADDARLGELLHLQVNGAFVDFPTPDEVQALGVNVGAIKREGAPDHAPESLALCDIDHKDDVFYVLEAPESLAAQDIDREGDALYGARDCQAPANSEGGGVCEPPPKRAKPTRALAEVVKDHARWKR